MNHLVFMCKSTTMNHQAVLLQLPIPNDCTHIINSYLFLEKIEYTNRLVKSSIHSLMKTAMNVYNDMGELDDVYYFRLFPTDKHQLQSILCSRCGNYKQLTKGILNQCCTCKCV